MVEPGPVSAPKSSLPPSLLVLFDSLYNVDFVNLTKRSLREKVEQLKTAVVKELAKKNDSRDNAPNHPPESSRTVSSQPVSVSSQPNKTIPKIPRRDNSQIKSTVVKDGEKPSKQAQSTTSTNKTGGLKPSTVPPKFSDLIKMAESGHRAPLNGSAEYCAGDTPIKSRREDRYPEKCDSSRTTDTRPTFKPLDKSSNKDSSSRNRDYQASPRQPQRSNGDTSVPSRRLSADLSKGISSSHSSATGNNRSRESKPSEVPSASRPETTKDNKDRKVHSRTRKKDEEERLLAVRKQKLLEEERRIKLRNEALSGKRSAQHDLKTLVTKSQGSTVLSCGRPAPSVPDRHTRGHIPPRRLPSRSHFDDFDEEEDEDMDDFIDDDEASGYMDNDGVSAEIRNIFGYDKRKYVDFDDDDIEESSFSQIQKEEIRSAKLGRQEDLADMRMELQHKKEKKRRLATQGR